MAGARSEDEGYFIWQEDNPLSNRKQDEEMKAQTKVARFCIKRQCDNMLEKGKDRNVWSEIKEGKAHNGL